MLHSMVTGVIDEICLQSFRAIANVVRRRNAIGGLFRNDVRHGRSLQLQEKTVVWFLAFVVINVLTNRGNRTMATQHRDTVKLITYHRR